MTESITIKTVGTLPVVAHHGDAGADLHAAEDMYIEAGEFEFIDTDTRIALPYGYYGAVVSRSGLARKYGVCVLNSPGVIDSGYRGSIGVTLKNDGPDGFVIKAGDRIAQLMIHRYVEVAYVAADSLAPTARGEGGFGSTGIDSTAAERLAVQ